jgi:diguanylate cyclase (GGDEF)-like protein/PAS domain S-box-containing protein
MSKLAPPRSLRRVIQTRWSLLVVAAALLLGGSFVLFGLRPISDRMAADQFNVAAMRVETRLNATFAPAEILLAMSRGWLDGRAPDQNRPDDFNRIFMPVLKALPQVTSVVAGTSTGQAWLLLEQPDGRWRNRMTNLPEWGARHQFFEHEPSGRVTHRWQALEYDARQRPWYQAALAGEANQVQWTDPYAFFTTGDPGISASTRISLKDGRDFVIGFDLMLRDLSRTTLSASVGKRGMAMVVTDDWRVLALPALPSGQQEDNWLKKVLQPVSKLGLVSIDDLRAAWLAADKTEAVFHFHSGMTPSMANVRPYVLGGQRFWVVVMAPTADFVPHWKPAAWSLAGGLAMILLLALLIARVQARAIARPLESLAMASERIGQLDFEPPPLVVSEIAEIHQLAEAQANMRDLLLSHQNRLSVQAEDLRRQIEALQAAEARIKESETYNKVLFFDSLIPLVVLDPETGRFVDCNQAAVRIYQLQDRSALLGLTPMDVTTPFQYDGRPSAEVIEEHVRLGLEQASDVFEFRHRRPDGSEWDAEVHLMAFRFSDRTLLQISLQDITERKGAKAKLQRLAFYDTLTGLPNRALLLDRLEQALANAQRHEQSLGLLFLDLDHFKEINDTQGHSMGDRVLQEVARRFQSVLRQDESMARMGGDEFIVLAAGADQVTAALIAERLLATLNEPLAAMGNRFSLAASIGIVLYPLDGKTADDLLQHADVAMYRAKSSGGSYRFYRSEMSNGLAERMVLVRDLKAALQKHHGELSLHYQPQVSLEDGRLTGAEALMRWHSPEHGMLSPAVFIPIAEERGLMVELGAWVLEEACQQLNTWQAEGLMLPGRLAVNIATQQIESIDFPEQALAIVRRAGLSPEMFDLELTESGLMRNVELAINIAGRLKAMGFSLSIDDFGTGYSSLAYLKRLPVGKVKIDISFVRDMLDDHNDYAIVNTIIGMGRTLDMTTLAEGVETPAQAETLLAMGCLAAQGYHFGAPESAAAFARRWLMRPM